MNSPAVRDTPHGAAISVKVHPRARKNAITGQIDGTLKVALTSPPVDGKANQACIEFFAEALRVPRSTVTITSGQSSRRKTIQIAGLLAKEVMQKLSIVEE